MYETAQSLADKTHTDNLARLVSCVCVRRAYEAKARFDFRCVCSMSDLYSLTFQEAHLRVVLEIANAALVDARRRKVELPPKDEDARQLLIRRIILAIEAGETDIPKLRELALHPGLERQHA